MPQTPQRSWHAWWRQTIWTPRVRGDVLQYVKIAAAALGGCALAGVSAALSAHTIVPPLLGLTEAASGLQGLFDQWPIIGPMLSSAIGLGGIFGYIAVAAVLTCVVNVLLTSQGPAETRRAWFTAHMALGFALAPLMTVGTALSAPVSVGAWACTAGLSLVLSGRLFAERTSWQAAIMGLCFGLGTAPMGAVAALGMASEAVLGNAVKCIALGSIASAFYRVWFNWSRLSANSTAMLDKYAQPKSDDARLSFEAGDGGTVFGVPEPALEFVHSAALKKEQYLPLDMMRLLLVGPEGTDQKMLAQAIAQHLDVALFAIPPHRLSPTDVLQVFQEAGEYSRRSHAPVILFFDKAHMLFCDRAQLDMSIPAERDAASVVNALLVCLDGASRPSDTNMIVIAATHAPQMLDPSIKQRFLARGTMGPPTKDDLRRMFDIKWAQLQHDLDVANLPARTVSEPQLSAALGHAHAAGFLGRHLDLLMEGVSRTVCVQHARYLQRVRQDKTLTFSVDAVMGRALDDVLGDVVGLIGEDASDASARPGRSESAKRAHVDAAQRMPAAP